jgi:triosephosphate isomerase
MTTVFTNWKMNKTLDDALSFFRKLTDDFSSPYGRDDSGHPNLDLIIIMCIPSIYILPVAPLVRGSAVFVGAENMHHLERGAYTGEESAPMLKSVGATHILIGHSERRFHCGETDESVHEKAVMACRHGLVPIICIGETAEEKSGGRMREVLTRQVRVCLEGLTTTSPCYVAYEPRWAIGAGVTPTDAEIADTFGYIRDQIRAIYGPGLSSHLKLLYGGSVNTDNSYSLCRIDQVDGVGLGGCSLDYDCFSRALGEVKRAIDGLSS